MQSRYENELENLKSENESLKEKFQTSTEKKNELSDLTRKYEKLKQMSSQTTDELLKSNKEITKIKTENKNLNENLKKLFLDLSEKNIAHNYINKLLPCCPIIIHLMNYTFNELYI